ncbi:uncharacterized protein LOC117575747 [Drosophila albomicans]|uniref:Uncharacterized protein LOC117575747 n=1 Tax=Drosophila albomicans TaxID=7291 RepID=A0A6P8XHS0_DROAB|nr:uncharacterized protein LOC117575747 [Drosophila albomicans]
MISDDSGVKFFDRKFVAANLRSQLRCPKCSNEYSHNHKKGVGKENHRPFLLPCGHNMCEFCISKQRQQIDFKCAVCFNLAPPTITAKNPKSAGNIRDYYEPNYHLLGLSNSLGYFKRYSVDSVNKSLQLTATQEIVVETKCSECGHTAAKGECKQCNAFYCKRCFENVHNHSRVLKTHFFQHLNEKQDGADKGIRVGKNIFRIPMPMQCSEHKLPANVFCRKCSRNCCKLCTSKWHNKHRTCLLDELNQRYLPEIPASINSIDAAIMKINNAQMVLKNTKKQFSDYAEETLAGISKHFRLLHGQLQNAELKAIEMLRESSLSPQMQLNEAMSQLNGYELVLMKLRKCLKPEVTDNIFLKDVICLIHEHLEKIPTSVKVSKLAGNPYFISNTVEKLSDIINRHFSTKFNNPQIKVKFCNEYNESSTISDISYGHQSQASAITCPNTNIQTQEYGPLAVALPSHRHQLQLKNHITSSYSNNSFEMNTQHSEILNSFSELDISNSNCNQKSNTLASQVGDWFKTGARVLVVSAKTPQDFYVQCPQTAQRIREQLKRFMTELSDCLTPKMINVGEQYVVRIKQNEIDRWQRALVFSKLAKPNTYKVFLPDVGVYETVQSNAFYEVPDSLVDLPRASVHCSLKQLMPSTGNSKWDPKAGAFLRQVVQKEVFVTVLRLIGPKFYEVDLTTTNYNSYFSVREAFLYTGLAHSKSGYTHAQLPNPQQQVAQASQKLKANEPHVGNMVMVQVLHVQHPQDFHVMWHKDGEKYEAKQTDLQHVMNGMSLANLEPIYMGRLHMACVLQWEGQWHRARIEEMLPDGYVVVRFVDSGVKQKLYWDMLVMLPKELWHPEFAIKCCLADVEPLQKHSYAWTKAGIDAFKQLTSNPKLIMEVISVRDNVAHVALHFTCSGRDNTNVAALLVAQGHCLSNGDSSKVRELTVVNQAPLDADTRKLIELTKKQLKDVEQPKPDDKLAPTIQRSEIEVLHVVSPSEFYVTLKQFMIGLAELKKSVQNAAVAMNETEGHLLQTDWQPGNMCYVWVKAKADMNIFWHRGKIISVADETDIEDKYNVQLCDIGELVEMVPASSLLPINDAMALIANGALRCQLYGLCAKDGAWSPKSIQFFKAQLDAYKRLYVTGHGRDGDCANVNLWGSFTEISGAFSPERTTFVSINEELIKNGWAVKDGNKQFDLPEHSASLNTITMLDTNNIDDDEVLVDLKNVDRLNAMTPVMFGPLPDQSFDYSDEMPPLQLLENFNDKTPTTGCNEAPLAWRTPRDCKKSIFTALPTYVNYQCEIYLSLSTDKPFNKRMCELLAIHFSLEFQNQVPGTYVVGQPVVVRYHLDQNFYRGIVQSKISSKGEYRVYYVDYGNVEKTLPAEMIPFAPFPHLNAMCFRIALDGMRPKEHKYDLNTMDALHNAVVMKLCSIRVMESKAPNGLPLCQVKVDNEDVVTMMVSNGWVLRKTSHDKQEVALPRPKMLESFKMFDELQQLGEVNNNTTVQPPPAKKKYTMQNQQMQHFECDEDFDCKEEALQQLQMSINCEQKSVSGFSDDYTMNNDDGIPLIKKKVLPISTSPEPDPASYSSSPHRSAIDQVRRRIQLRNKDRLDTSHFSPMDTSTERSYRTDVGCLKAPNLPRGVMQFKCCIDKVLSATELQISPKLSEFTKHDIGLTQETSALIKRAKRLYPVVLDAVCLARYTQDNQWYRAIIKELHQSSQQATVFYIDFHDTEMVPFTDLKSFPKELFMFPRRTFRVNLHGIRMNTNFNETAVRHSLQTCLCQYPEVFARVHYPPNYHDNNNDDSSEESMIASFRKEFQLLEVDIFENEHTSNLLYKPLIDSEMFLLN